MTFALYFIYRGGRWRWSEESCTDSQTVFLPAVRKAVNRTASLHLSWHSLNLCVVYHSAWPRNKSESKKVQRFGRCSDYRKGLPDVIIQPTFFFWSHSKQQFSPITLHMQPVPPWSMSFSQLIFFPLFIKWLHVAFFARLWWQLWNWPLLHRSRVCCNLTAFLIHLPTGCPPGPPFGKYII